MNVKKKSILISKTIKNHTMEKRTIQTLHVESNEKNDLAFQWKNFFEFQMHIDKHTHTNIYIYI